MTVRKDRWRLPAGARLQRYTINGIGEETACSWCGWPLLSGDRSILLAEVGDDQDEGLPCCGRVCATELARDPEAEPAL